MDIKTKRFLLLIVSCSAAGVILGGTSAWAESNQCLQAQMPTSNCLVQDPIIETFEGMAVGLVAGAAAAVGATFQIKQDDK